jgi:hypothetical protein
VIQTKERLMNDERRGEERSPAFRSVELVTTDSDENERSYPVILRDSSAVGMGGVYIGDDPPNPDSEFVLRDVGSADRRIRIVWTKKVADFVEMLGFEIAEG